MAKNKKVEETNMEFPELPIPEEPSLEEQLRIANQELENKYTDLLYKVYQKEEQVDKLKREIELQRNTYEKAIANLVLTFCGKE